MPFADLPPVSARRRPLLRAAVVLLVAALFGCDGGSRSSGSGGLPPVTAAATVAPLGAMVRAVAGRRAEVEVYAAGARRVGDYGGRDSSQSPYRPDAAGQSMFRRAAFLAVDGRADAWALGGLSEEMAGSPVGPVLQLASLPAAAGGEGGALWLDPVVLAGGARDAAERLGVLRPKAAGDFRAAADRLANRLEGVAAGRTPRWAKVAVVDAEPLPLLNRLGVEAVRVEPEPSRAVPSPEQVAQVARAAGASAVLLPSDWAGETRDAWREATGLPVALYSPLGPASLASAPDPADALVAWAAANLDELAWRNDR